MRGGPNQVSQIWSHPQTWVLQVTRTKRTLFCRKDKSLHHHLTKRTHLGEENVDSRRVSFRSSRGKMESWGGQESTTVEALDNCNGHQNERARFKTSNHP